MMTAGDVEDAARCLLVMLRMRLDDYHPICDAKDAWT